MRLLYEYEVPVAVSMRQYAHDVAEPMPKYALLWAAFNACYTTLYTSDTGRRRHIRRDESGRVTRDINGDVEVPRVSGGPSEGDQLRHLARQVPVNVLSALMDRIPADDPRSFLNRTPLLDMSTVETDADGYRLNGVINVGSSVSREYPVWAPLSLTWHERFRNGDRTTEIVEGLSRQVIWILYTVRNNLVHGGKRAHAENDVNVVEQAIPLLEVLLDWLLHQTDA